MPPIIDMDRCSGCGTCDLVCPGDLIHMDEVSSFPVVQYPDECWHCGCCRIVCPAEAIEIKFPLEVLV
ncbi:MAG: ferredoxin family protein [Chloroflexi bacterium]|nr:ferredoxin family protein [Chloroflexota bacterium]